MQNSTEKLIAMFRALADPARLRLLALCARGECAVSELTEVLGLSQPRVSQHLKQLCAAGLMRRFRDGHFVYYRAPFAGGGDALQRAALRLLPGDEPQFERDLEKLRALRARQAPPESTRERGDERQLHKALIELTVSAPLGDLLDIGCGHGSLLKLLASRARRVVGVDIDADARQFARTELLLAGIGNCSLRQGDMYSLPFADACFDTVILDDVLRSADRPTAALAEAGRVLRPAGRLILLASSGTADAPGTGRRLAEWCGLTGLRLAQPRYVGGWMIAVATPASGESAAA
jgi:ArsR family transcriptional regulator